MLKYFILLTAFIFTACDSKPTTPGGADPTPPVVVDQEPATHEPALMISEEGMKRGGIKKLPEQSMWRGSDWNSLPSPRPPDNTPTCGQFVKDGVTCTKGAAACRTQNEYYVCDTSVKYKVYGWVYEKKSLTEFVPFENVKVTYFRFTDCMMGGPCENRNLPVYTDKWGYFEFIATSFEDTLSTKSPAGYFGYCSRNEPIFVNGSNFAFARPEGEKAFGAFKHQKLKEDSCK